ncbi:MAG: hypothetical protein MUP30_08010, partial [Deltaproteobacteria bacterium]|nr:hypothetical protein [Deltaproteobacteria bacterium]
MQEKGAVFTLSAYPLKMTQVYEIMNKSCFGPFGMIFVLLITEEERGYEPRTNKQRNKEDKKMLEAMATLIL